MEIFKIIGIAICTLIATMLIRNVKPEFGVVVSLSGGILILLVLMQMLGDVFYNFNLIVSKTGVSNDVFKMLIKVVGIGYLTEFSSGICLDAGGANLAEYVALGGRIVILVLCFPIIKSLLELVVGLV